MNNLAEAVIKAIFNPLFNQIISRKNNLVEIQMIHDLKLPKNESKSNLNFEIFDQETEEILLGQIMTIEESLAEVLNELVKNGGL